MERITNAKEIGIRSVLKPGDIGYITYLHGALYAAEYGYDEAFEAYVAQGFCEFLANNNRERDRLWVAEDDASIVGSIAVKGREHDEAQLRWFLVHPSTRGIGLGRKLMQAAVAFCRERGFRSMYLWTTSELKAAAHVYHTFGFRKTQEKTHTLWSKSITENRYDLSF